MPRFFYYIFNSISPNDFKRIATCKYVKKKTKKNLRHNGIDEGVRLYCQVAQITNFDYPI